MHESKSGEQLSTTPVALDSNRSHFTAQFRNEAAIALFTTTTPATAQDHQFSRFIFTSEYVAQCISLSRKGKAPGITGVSVDILQPASRTLSSVLELMFTTYFDLGCSGL